MSAYLRTKYSQKVLGKWSPFQRAQFQRRTPRTTPGWIGDADQRRFRFDRWAKLPDAAKALYHRVRARSIRASPCCATVAHNATIA